MPYPIDERLFSLNLVHKSEQEVRFGHITQQGSYHGANSGLRVGVMPYDPVKMMLGPAPQQCDLTDENDGFV
jgi:hypothetical protein